MSDPETTTTPAEDGQPDPAEETSHATEDPGTPDDPTADPARRARSEARRLRERLHAAEAERDTLAATVDGYRRTHAERAAESAGLASGGDLWAAGTDLAGLLGEDGHVDPARVAETVGRLLADRPHWRRRLHGSVDQGPRGSAPTGRTWHDALGGR